MHNSHSNTVLLAAGERCIKLAEEVRRTALNENIDFTLINARFLKPLDTDLLSSLPQKHVITLEDNAIIGGLGDSVARFYRKIGSNKVVRSFGYPDEFIPHGKPKELMDAFGLNPQEILDAIKKLYEG